MFVHILCRENLYHNLPKKSQKIIVNILILVCLDLGTPAVRDCFYFHLTQMLNFLGLYMCWTDFSATHSTPSLSPPPRLGLGLDLARKSLTSGLYNQTTLINGKYKYHWTLLHLVYEKFGPNILDTHENPIRNCPDCSAEPNRYIRSNPILDPQFTVRTPSGL